MTKKRVDQIEDKNRIISTRLYTRFILDPFQIYCLANRKSFKAKFPDKKNSELTSMLASSWRALTDEKKHDYQMIASKLEHNKCKIKRKIRESTKNQSRDGKGQMNRNDVVVSKIGDYEFADICNETLEDFLDEFSELLSDD